MSCGSVYVTSSHGGGRDFVTCQKPPNHKGEHHFAYKAERKGETEHWTDAEAGL